MLFKPYFIPVFIIQKMKINLFQKRKLIDEAKKTASSTGYERELENQLKRAGMTVDTQKTYPLPDGDKRKYKTADLVVKKHNKDTKTTERLAVHVDGGVHDLPKVKIKDKEAETEIGFYGHDQIRVKNSEVINGSALKKILEFFKWL